MTARNHPHATPPDEDDDGVRVIRVVRSGRRTVQLGAVLAVSIVVIGTALSLWSLSGPNLYSHPGDTVQGAASAPVPSSAAIPISSGESRQASPRRAPAPASGHKPDPVDWFSADPNDIASHISPDDPVPSVAELIDALHHVGDYGGIGAFNPPGTSPPLQGLAVPADFVLPPGYVRHHQFTDEGEPIEAILMFSPDFVFRDSSGKPISIPEDRVVPPELAPPDLPLRQVRIPKS